MTHPELHDSLRLPPELAADQPLPIDSIRAWMQNLDRGLDSVQFQSTGSRIPSGNDRTPADPPMLPAACRRRTHLIDSLIEALWARVQRRHGCGNTALAFFALGSYGRCELCPYSDIDLLILHDAAADGDALKRWLADFITPLWDLGLKASHVVYQPEDLTRQFSQLSTLDVEAPTAPALQKQVTSLLDSRLLTVTTAGQSLADLLPKQRSEFLRRHGFALAQHKAREIGERWGQLHIRPWEIPTPCYLEPNLKDGPGGLRDSLAAQWIDRALAAGNPLPPSTTGAPDIARSRQEHHAQLLAVRTLLHRAAGRAQDRLMQGLQPDVAGHLVAQFQPGRMGEEDSERLHMGLQPMYRAMIAIHNRAEALCRQVAAGPRIARRPTPRQRLDREILHPHWMRVGSELHPSVAGNRELAGPDALTVALQGFELAHQNSLRPGATWLDGLRSRLITRPLETIDPVATRIFCRLLTRAEPLYPLFLPMHFSGILSVIIPEFGDITGRSQRAPLHEVTVDVHTLRVLGALEHWHLTQREEDRERVSLLRSLDRIDLLRWAALLHDIGKSRGDAGHAERGSLMAHDILTRLNYPPEDIRRVRMLVEEHLALFNLTTLDSDDRGPFHRLATRLVTPAAVDQLYLLTIADAQGVAVGALPLWREDRLRHQWRTLREFVAVAHESGAAHPDSAQQPAELRQSLLTGLPSQISGGDRRLRRKLTAHLEAMATRYLTRVSTADALAHLQLIDRLGSADATVEILPPTQPPTTSDKPTAQSASRTRSRGAGAKTVSERRRAAVLQSMPPPIPIGEMRVVTHDRPGRFSQICAGLTGAGLSVISAEVYERADGIILDLFRVMPIPELNAGLASAQILPHFLQNLEHARALLLKILHDPSCASEIMTHILGHPLLSAARQNDRGRAEATVHLTNASHEPLTIVDVRCPDRAGLLYALTRAIADLGLNIHFATIDTVRGMATDVFYLSETNGKNLRDAERRRNLRLLLKAVAETPLSGG